MNRRVILAAVGMVAGGILALASCGSSTPSASSTRGASAPPSVSAACAEIRNAISQGDSPAASTALLQAWEDVRGTSTFDLAVQDLASSGWPSPAGLQAIESTCGISASSLQALNPNPGASSSSAPASTAPGPSTTTTTDPCYGHWVHDSTFGCLPDVLDLSPSPLAVGTLECPPGYHVQDNPATGQPDDFLPCNPNDPSNPPDWQSLVASWNNTINQAEANHTGGG